MASQKQRKKRRKKGGKRKKPTLQQILLSISIVVAITGIVLSPVLKAGFSSLDDEKLIVENVQMLDKSPEKILRLNRNSPHFKPLIYGSWVLEYRMFGMQPFTFHLINLLYHLANSILVFFLALGLVRKFRWTNSHPVFMAVVISLLFGLHPMHVESVAWAVERKDVMFSFFALLSLLAYMRHLNKKSWAWIGLSALTFFLSGLCKAQALAVPFLLFVLDYAYGRNVRYQTLFEKVPHAAVMLIILFLYGFFSNDGSEAELAEFVTNRKFSDLQPLSGWPGMYGKTVLLGLKGILFYIHTWLPFRLAFAYPYKIWIPALGPWLHLFPFLFALGIYLLYRIRKSFRLVFFGHAFFIAALLPALIRTGLGQGIFLSDRYIYLACFGFVFFLAGLVQHLIRKNTNHIRWQYGMMGAIIAVYGFFAFQNARLWENQEKLWSNVIEKYPGIAHAHLNRAIYYLNVENDEDKAMTDLTRAIEIEPLIHALTRRGHLYRQRRQFGLALQDFEQALAIDPEDPHALNGKAHVLFDQNRHQEAITYYDRALANDPNFTEFYVNKAAALYHLRRYEEGLEQLRIAARIQPDYYGIFDKQVVIYIGLGQYQKALEAGRRLAEIQPQNDDNYFKMGYALQAQGKHSEAIAEVSKAIGLNPQMKKYYNLRAKSYEALGQYQAAQQDRARGR